jgi:UDP-2-acetamido-2-deoxy-ribo-hexuluronate aminotransferase
VATSQQVMSLPMSADLTEAQQDQVVAALARALA